MRTFSKTIRQAIERSGLAQKEIAERCVQVHGVQIDASYISKMQADACKPPSDRIVRALAKILELDPDKLAAQAHIDRAPEELRRHLAAV